MVFLFFCGQGFVDKGMQASEYVEEVIPMQNTDAEGTGIQLR